MLKACTARSHRCRGPGGALCTTFAREKTQITLIPSLYVPHKHPIQQIAVGNYDRPTSEVWMCWPDLDDLDTGIAPSRLFNLETYLMHVSGIHSSSLRAAQTPRASRPACVANATHCIRPRTVVQASSEQVRIWALLALHALIRRGRSWQYMFDRQRPPQPRRVMPALWDRHSARPLSAWRLQQR